MNYVTRKDVFHCLSLIDEYMDTFSKLGGNSAFHQIKIRPEDQNKTIFVTHYGLSEFARMGFRLCYALAKFSRAMNLVSRGHHLEYCIGLP